MKSKVNQGLQYQLLTQQLRLWPTKILDLSVKK